jgi:hypothetical protein
MTMKRKPQKLALLGVRSTKAKTGIRHRPGWKRGIPESTHNDDEEKAIKASFARYSFHKGKDRNKTSSGLDERYSRVNAQ